MTNDNQRPQGDAKAGKCRAKMYALIICGQTGMPKVDNPLDVPDEIWKTFTQKEKNHINNSVLEHLRRYD